MKVERAPALTEGLRIIEMAAASDEPITFENILADIEMSRSSANRLIKVLVESGYLHMLEGYRSGYIPGIRLFSMVRHLDTGKDRHFEYLRIRMAAFSERTRTSIQYAVLDRTVNRITILHKSQCENSLSVAGYGIDATQWANRHVLGKLILAYCGVEERKAILEHCKPEKMTKHTVMPGPEFDQILNNVLKCGYAEDLEEAGDHMFRTGLPVFSKEGVIEGAICSAWFAPGFDKKVAADLRKGLSEIVSTLNADVINPKKELR